MAKAFESQCKTMLSDVNRKVEAIERMFKQNVESEAKRLEFASMVEAARLALSDWEKMKPEITDMAPMKAELQTIPTLQQEQLNNASKPTPIVMDEKLNVLIRKQMPKVMNTTGQTQPTSTRLTQEQMNRSTRLSTPTKI